MLPRLKPKPLVLLLLPLAELLMFYFVAGWMGSFNAFLLLAVLFVAGVVVLRQVGTDSIKRLTMRIQMGEGLNRNMLDAAMVFASGFLLLVPGFITGFIGLLLIFPWSREIITRKVLKHAALFTYGQNGTILDGEYDHVADNDEVKK